MERSTSAAIVLASTAVALFCGCATTGGSEGVRLLRRGDYGAAVAALRQEEEARPADAAIKRDLGVALLESGDPAAAAASLEQSRSLDPRDPRTLFFLGKAQEAAQKPDDAISAYTQCLAAGGHLGRKERAAVQARIEALSRAKAAREIQRALAEEERLKTAEMPENTVAVPDFSNVARSDTLAPLARGLSAMVVTDLSRVHALRILERERLNVLTDELNLAAGPGAGANTWHPLTSVLGTKERLASLKRPDGSGPYYSGPLDDSAEDAYVSAVKAFQADHGLTADGIAGPKTRSALDAATGPAQAGSPAAPAPAATVVDPDTAPRLGRILGARRFVQGAFAPLRASEIQLDASIIRVPDGTLAPAGEAVSGALPDVLRLEKRLVYQILQALGITPTQEERQQIDRLPTQSFLAFLAYSRGLQYEDRGMTAEALAAYREALRLDPSFENARTREEVGAVTPADQSALDKAELQELGPPAGAQRNGVDRLMQTGGLTALGPTPQLERGDEADPAPNSAGRVTGTESDAEIIVEGRLPEGVVR